ncbi:heavy-metal-associated domain-containing protein [Candidatus Uhrbacteria bacterium]|nr:heavy-metal-associated domain-containing protein [Candidatus Uhrbacteria bacterium]
MTTTLIITGMHCASCKALIEDVCSEIAGVRSCSVDVAKGEAVVEHDESVAPSLLAKEIEGLGKYGVRV